MRYDALVELNKPVTNTAKMIYESRGWEKHHLC